MLGGWVLFTESFIETAQAIHEILC